MRATDNHPRLLNVMAIIEEPYESTLMPAAHRNCRRQPAVWHQHGESVRTTHAAAGPR
jgi:hypothetical protein